MFLYHRHFLFGSTMSTNKILIKNFDETYFYTKQHSAFQKKNANYRLGITQYEMSNNDSQCHHSNIFFLLTILHDIFECTQNAMNKWWKMLVANLKEK